MKSLRNPADREETLDKCLTAFVKAGTLDLSLDKLAKSVGTSKRMLIHYFGGRVNLEELAMGRLEDRLRQRFRADSFPPGASLPDVVAALWEQTTHPESKGILLLVMDLTRRSWKGSKRAKAFYLEQQRLWVELLQKFSADSALVESVLQLFQGAVLVYLVTGDRDIGKRSISRFFRAC